MMFGCNYAAPGSSWLRQVFGCGRTIARQSHARVETIIWRSADAQVIASFAPWRELFVSRKGAKPAKQQ
jgi:hypothetical protein